MIRFAFASARAVMSRASASPLARCAGGVGLRLGLGDGLLGLGLDLADPVLGLDRLLRLLHRAVDRGRHVLRQAERAVDGELVDDEAVLAELLAEALA